MDVPVVDLEGLSDVPLHHLRHGTWLPRAICLELGSLDSPQRGGFRRRLNDWSRALPREQSIALRDASPLFDLASVILPSVSTIGRRAATPLDNLASAIDGWSSELASTIQKRSWRFAEALSALRLTASDLKRLTPSEVHAVSVAVKSLASNCRDVAGICNEAADAAPKRWSLRSIAADRGHALAAMIHSFAGAVRRFTDEDSWRTFCIHIQFGVGIESHGASTRAGVLLLFPTLEQVMREGLPKVRIVSRIDPAETLVGGINHDESHALSRLV